MQAKRAGSFVAALLAAGGLFFPGSAVLAQEQPKPATPAPTLIPFPINRPVPLPGQVTPTPQVVPPRAPEALVWDANEKELTVQPGAATAEFFFAVTNISEAPYTITSIHTSCGCTVAKAPPMPWTLAPHSDGRVDVSVNLAGKSGTIMKQVTVQSTNAPKLLNVTIKIPDSPEMKRLRNMQMATADPSAIFKGECASCHVIPAVGKFGPELSQAACGICHEAERRATMVPDLKNIPHPTDYAFWKEIISNGKPGTLMPGFSIAKNGPLSVEQIESLAQFYAKTIPSKVTLISGTNTTQVRLPAGAGLPQIPPPPAPPAPPALPAIPK